MSISNVFICVSIYTAKIHTDEFWLAAQGSEGSAGEPTTDEPPVHICTWHPEEEDSSPAVPTADVDVTISAPHSDREVFKVNERERTALGAALPAAKVPAATQGGSSYFCVPWIH